MRRLEEIRTFILTISIFLLISLLPIPPAAVLPHSDQTQQAEVQAAYGRLPLSFEANVGQTDPRVTFLSRGRGYTLFLTPGEAVLTLRQPVTHQAPTGSRTQTSRGTVLRMQFVGASPRPEIAGAEELPGKTNYFIGNDPAKWRTNIPTYAQVRYREIYPGIDLVFYGRQGILEYDFIVAPGADPKRVVVDFQGTDRIQLGAHGDLVIHLARGQLHLRRPVVYQEIGGVRRIRAGGYTLKGQSQVAFSVGAYDAGRPLIIDPVLAYATYLGGSSDDTGNGLAVDASGNAYVTGRTQSADFATTTGAFDASGDGEDAFVTKLNATGSALVYSTYIGGADGEDVRDLVADGGGNVYLTGLTRSTDFPTTAGAFDTTWNGAPYDGFVTKLNATGSGLLYSTYLGGASADIGGGIAVDAGGNAYVAGNTSSANFPTTPGAFDTTLGGGNDAFVTKLNASGSGLLYSTFLGGAGPDAAADLALDASGNAYVTGNAGSADFPTSAGAFDTTLGGGSDAFVTKLNASGSALLYSTYLGGVGSDDGGRQVAVDASGNVHVMGHTRSADFPTTAGAFDATWNGNFDAFVTKLSDSGSALLYSTYLGGADWDQGNAFAVDAGGNVYVTGFTRSTDFPTAGALDTTLGGGSDAFVTKLSDSGSALLYSTYLGGGDEESGRGIAVDAARSAYVTGRTWSVDFPTTDGVFDRTRDGLSDGFVAKIATPSFTDVAPSDWGYNWIEQIFHRGVTAGCGSNPARYCPDNNVSRREMAVFLVRSMGQTQVSPCTGVFADVPTTDWGCGWIERIAQLGITAGCATNPLRYCPDDPVTRAQMAVFLNRAVGQDRCDTCGPTFADVPSTYWAFGWIERLFQRSITAGCATNPLRYCPDNNVSRREMAVFLIRNFP